jgi:DNA-binding protein HU-beta
MSTQEIVRLLIEDRDRLNMAIEALQGSPVETTRDAAEPAVKQAPAKKKGGLSAAGRKAIAEAARKRWAALRAAKSRPMVRAVPTIVRRTTESITAAPAVPKAPAKKVAKRKAWTPAMKKAHTARMKAFWAAKRKAAAKGK